MGMNDVDEKMMRRALALARRGEGRVEPNPRVGCVIVRDGRVIGEGFHRRFGGPHAEMEALRSCTRSPRGSTVYVTLEPCCHYGKTSPCTEALMKADVAEVVIPLLDPNPAVSGGGVRRLRGAGVSVRTGVLADQAAEVLAPFLTYTCLRRPYVIAKWAQSLDGRLVTPPRESPWISGEPSRRSGHRLRARVDAVLVGVGTVVADDPLLTARDVPLRRQAMRVVLDEGLRFPERCRLVETAEASSTLVFTARQAAGGAKANRLRRRGVEVVACRAGRGGISLAACLGQLAERGVTNLLVEGGARVLSSFLREGLVDEAIVYVAPRFIGDVVGEESSMIRAAIRPRTATVRASGEDMMYRFRLTRPPRARPQE